MDFHHELSSIWIRTGGIWCLFKAVKTDDLEVCFFLCDQIRGTALLLPWVIDILGTVIFNYIYIYVCVCIHLKLLQVFITHEMNTILRWGLHQSISLAKVQKAFKAHGCKLLVTNSSIVLHTLGILTRSVTCCTILFELLNEFQVKVCVV